jgi:hypothetical protein
VVTLLEHNSTVLNATAVGNPADIKYTWYFNSSDVMSNVTDVIMTSATGPTMVLNDVTVSQAGTYSCLAANHEGTSWLAFTINVLGKLVLTD